jgi:cell fate regulator YaaT (PSP1 superfamily)
VVVSVDRGEDLGRVLSKISPEERPDGVAGELARLAGRDDLERDRRNRPFEKRVLDFTEKRVAARGLDMRLTGCECQLDRKKIRIYFTADHRMDFRELVRDLAAEYHARIELRQLGVRDDARHKDGVGICGRRLCCAGFLGEFSSVTLRAVREQHLSPNPAKVSGVCSRLMCCLAYEYDFYRKANRSFPDPGSTVRLGEERVRVDRIDIFGDLIRVVHEDGSAEELSSEEFHRRKEQKGRKKSSAPRQRRPDSKER